MANTPDTKPDTPSPPSAEQREISGPGAADFLTSQGGLDRPETDASKGTGRTREGAAITDARRLVPNLDEAGAAAEKKWETPLDEMEASRDQERNDRQRDEKPR